MLTWQPWSFPTKVKKKKKKKDRKENTEKVTMTLLLTQVLN